MGFVFVLFVIVVEFVEGVVVGGGDGDVWGEVDEDVGVVLMRLISGDIWGWRVNEGIFWLVYEMWWDLFV